ncbi:WXG100 family type VII secretion target [Leucobacter exalbidus]|uniref:ESAT-6-like protein n=1 Tax=Leucobacter exalbidus TaxID=662960 RepID=A0A940T4L6_9MICO|nr:WXG100 family type VII secretion target [Leucobacter exalbidus]MBP1327063.1 WXG100 family type VII secretion target [Leucobacter exalbidus]
MANINVSYADMEQAGTQLGGARDEISQKLQQMQTLIGTLVGSGFVTDQASGKFHQAYAEYTTSANTVIAKLTEIQAFLSQTATAMHDMDSQIAARIN